MITLTTDIAAPPSVVREILLEFSSLSTWHSGFINSIESQTPGKSAGRSLEPGDRIVSNITGMVIQQTIEENSSHELRWRGPWHGILTGVHGFTFEEREGGKSTKLVQWEDFTGVLAWFMKPGMPGGKKTADGFVKLNGDLKKKAEEEARKANR